MEIKVNNQKPGLCPKAGDRPSPTKRPTGRQMVNDSVRLRLYIAMKLREAFQPEGFDSEHWGPAAVTAERISQEKQGVRGIHEETNL